MQKTEDETQLQFKGGDYSIDSIRSVNSKHFVTGSQDGKFSLWATKKNKPMSEVQDAHGECWITSVVFLKQFNL